MATTKVKHGKHLKSIWKTAASGFSNPPEKGARASRLFSNTKNADKRNLGTAASRATLAVNEKRREISRVSCLPARTGNFSDRKTVH
jgi:hypothetical protein